MTYNKINTPIDAHIHTPWSDWKKIWPWKLNKEIYCILTNHNTFSPKEQDKINKITKKNNPYWVEISANIWWLSVHILLYTKKINKKAEKKIEEIKNLQKEKTETSIETLKKIIKEDNEISENIKEKINNISYETLAKHFKVKQPNSWHLKKFLDGLNIEKNKINVLIGKIKEKEKKEKNIKIEASKEDIEEIKSLQWKNSILSLAHPFYTFWWDEIKFKNFLKKHYKIFNAIEINSQTPRNWVKLIKQQARKYWLILTFWSDSHWEKSDKHHGKLWAMNKYVYPKNIKENIEKFQKIINTTIIRRKV